MNDEEYKKFLIYLFDDYIRGRLPEGRKYFHMLPLEKYGFEGVRRKLQKAVLMFRYIYFQCDSDNEINRTFTPKALQENIGTIMDSQRSNVEIMKKLGFLDCLESHYDEIISELKAEHLPELDREILEELGSRNPNEDLKGIIYLLQKRIKRRPFTNNQSRMAIGKCLKEVDGLIKEGWEGYYAAEEGRTDKPPQKTRRWFKSLGQVGQGVALSLGNIGMALGALKFPVSPETQTWGALVSSATGVGMIMNGIGELRGE